MGDMNYIGAIVKILEVPKEKLINSNTLVIKFRAQLPQVRKDRVVKLVFWNNLALAVRNYYKVNDYILIEGYTSIRKNSTSNKSLKKVTISVVKVYPLLLNSNRSINKLS
jgi:hypothetical protein